MRRVAAARPVLYMGSGTPPPPRVIADGNENEETEKEEENMQVSSCAQKEEAPQEGVSRLAFVARGKEDDGGVVCGEGAVGGGGGRGGLAVADPAPAPAVPVAVFEMVVASDGAQVVCDAQEKKTRQDSSVIV